MVDRHARNILAEATRHFVTCLSTNYQFDDVAFSVSTKDRGVLEIRQQIWLIYDDLHEHKLDGKWALSVQQCEVIHRIILFLKSDAEYSWPKVPLWYRFTRPFIWLLSFGTVTRTLDERYSRNLDLTVWPYRKSEEIEEARRHPKYLAGAASS
jgi:hypothetical protein